MKKLLLSLVAIMLITSGCTSYITAQYDDFKETFTGAAGYDPTYGRAVITLKSDQNGTLCTGNTPFYRGLYVYHFNLVCSDGRMITGTMPHGSYTGKAFTNRNEILSFSISKTKKGFRNNNIIYRQSADKNPPLDNTKEPIQVIMQPNIFY